MTHMHVAAIFFRQILNCYCHKVCVENPVPHRYAVEAIGRKYDQIIQPYMFGEPETKKTCLWLKGLPPLMCTMQRNIREPKCHMEPPGPDRWKNRSRTFQGIANAMAEQWG